MNKDELLKIYSAYLPYQLRICDSVHNPDFILDEDNLGDVLHDAENLNTIKPYLYDLSYLTKEALVKAGFDSHIDCLTHERENWIKKEGFDRYINRIPYGQIQWLLKNHYNVFNIPADQFINKATLKEK